MGLIVKYSIFVSPLMEYVKATRSLYNTPLEAVKALFDELNAKFHNKESWQISSWEEVPNSPIFRGDIVIRNFFGDIYTEIPYYITPIIINE